MSSKLELAGRAATFTHDTLCQRQLIVLQDHSLNAKQTALTEMQSASETTFDTLARGSAIAAVPETQCDLQEVGLQMIARDALLKKLSRQMGRGGASSSVLLIQGGCKSKGAFLASTYMGSLGMP